MTTEKKEQQDTPSDADAPQPSPPPAEALAPEGSTAAADRPPAAEEEASPAAKPWDSATGAPQATAGEPGSPPGAAAWERDAEEQRDAAAAVPPPARAVARTTRSYMWAYLAAIPLLVAIGAYGAWQFVIKDQLAGMQAAHADLEQRFAAAVDRMKALEDAVAPVAALEEKVQPLIGRIDRVITDVGDLKTVTAPTVQLAAKAADIEQRLNRLDQQIQEVAATHLRASDILDRVQRLETNAVATATIDQRLSELERIDLAKRESLARASSVVLAVGHVATAVNGSEAFATELTTLKSLAGGDEQLAAAVTALEPFAATGVPTLAKLRAEFPAVAIAVSREESAARGEDWTDRVLYRLSTLVTVRRVGADAAATGGTDGLLAEAENALAEGELATAVAAVGNIEGPGAKAAAAWLEAARARLAADAAVAALGDRAITYLSQLKG